MEPTISGVCVVSGLVDHSSEFFLESENMFINLLEALKHKVIVEPFCNTVEYLKLS